MMAWRYCVEASCRREGSQGRFMQSTYVIESRCPLTQMIDDDLIIRLLRAQWGIEIEHLIFGSLREVVV